MYTYISALPSVLMTQELLDVSSWLPRKEGYGSKWQALVSPAVHWSDLSNLVWDIGRHSNLVIWLYFPNPGRIQKTDPQILDSSTPMM